MGQSINSEQRQLMFKLEREVEIGLSLCKSIIQAHDGKIWAENIDKERQKKAKFSFIIPVKKIIK